MLLIDLKSEKHLDHLIWGYYWINIVMVSKISKEWNVHHYKLFYVRVHLNSCSNTMKFFQKASRKHKSIKNSQIKIEWRRRMEEKVILIVNWVNCLYYTMCNYLYEIIKTILSFTMCLHYMVVTHSSFNNLNKLIT